MPDCTERTEIDKKRDDLNLLLGQAEYYERLADVRLESKDFEGSDDAYEILQDLFDQINCAERVLEDQNSDI